MEIVKLILNLASIIILILIFLKIKEIGIMAEDVKNLLIQFAQRIDIATNEIAALIQNLRDDLANGKITPEEMSASLEPLVARLEAMGKDTNVV